MSLAAFSVARPVLISMACLIVALLGLVALRLLRIDMLPAIERPTLSVRTEYEGADPEVVERLVTQILEEVLATVPGVAEMTSTSAEGRSDIRLDFTWGTDIDVAAEDVRALLEQESDELPNGALRPQVRKDSLANFPVVLLGISSRLDPVELNDIADNQVRQRLSRLQGVAQIDIFGGYAREVRIELIVDRLRGLGLTPAAILSALRDANLDLPVGSIESGQQVLTLRAPAEFASLDDIRAAVLAVRDGATITVSDVATVRETHQKLNRAVRIDGEPGIRIACRKQLDANTVEVADRILAEVAAINHDLPTIHLVPVINQGNFIERSISNVVDSVVTGGLLAVLILLFFLRNLRSTVVIALSIPLSILATLFLLHAGGLTLNLMTLGGLALGVGMMVDNSIVVLENIFRRRDEEHEPIAIAAVRGTQEVAAAVVASTLTTVVIFLPLFFIESITGLLFRELAVVVVVSLAASLAVALTLVPMLAAKLLRPPSQTPGWAQRLANAAGGALAALDRAYRDLLLTVLRWRILTITAVLLILGSSLFLAPRIGNEFLPPTDEGEVKVTGEMAAGTRLDLADALAREIEALIAPAVPEAVSIVTTVNATGAGGGPGGASTATRAELQIAVGPASTRERSNTAIADELRRRLEGRIPGMTIRTRAPQGQFLLERLIGGNDGFKIELRGNDLAVMEDLAAQALAALGQVTGITDAQVDAEQGIPQLEFRIDRDKVADAGLTVRQVAELLQAAIGGRSAGDFRPAGQSYRIFVKAQGAESLALDDILDQALTGAGGVAIPLRSLLTTRPGEGPAVIRRKDQRRTYTITANLSGLDLGTVARQVQPLLAAIPVPADHDLRLAGAYAQQKDSSRDMLISLSLALLLVYMVMASQYESLRDPLIVMFSVPVAAIGVLVTLFITRSTFNVQSGIGCIMLGGIVVNNAILLVDQAGQLRRAGMATLTAVAEAGRRRLRPILMTTLTTILGLLPLAMGIGEGAEAQAPLARAVVGGLISSTLITLVLIPVIYTFFHRDRDA